PSSPLPTSSVRPPPLASEHVPTRAARVARHRRLSAPPITLLRVSLELASTECARRDEVYRVRGSEAAEVVD
ncbi:hypothetical protein BKA93DRAFT_778741, partial [Sparassis latifolia]